MEVRSIYKYARISPKKARDVAREIQGLPVSDAIDTLNFTPKKAAFLIGKTLKSAVANAENNHDLAADSLHVKEANISEGPLVPPLQAAGAGIGQRDQEAHQPHLHHPDRRGGGSEEKPARERKPKSKAARSKPAPRRKKKLEPRHEAAEEIEEETGRPKRRPRSGSSRRGDRGPPKNQPEEEAEEADSRRRRNQD